MKISVITPSIREPELSLNFDSLLQQTFPREDFEWLVCSPFVYEESDVWIEEPAKNDGDFMGENKAYNQLFKRAKGELIVTLNDSIWLQSEVLEMLWNHYIANQRSCVCIVGDHYETVSSGVGYDITYSDVRREQMRTLFESTTLTNFDACVSSIPASAVKLVGSIDEIWDKYCCFGIREFMAQVRKHGYELYISKEVEFVGQKHTKEYDPNNLWNEKFREGEQLFKQRNSDVTL